MHGSGVPALLAVHGKEWSEGEAVRGSREGCGEGSSSGAVGDLNRPELGSPWSGCRRGARAQASVPRGPGEEGEWSGRAAFAGEQRGQRSGAAMPCPGRGSRASWGQQGRGDEVAEEKGRGRCGVVLLAGQRSRGGPGGKLRDTAAKNTAACRAGRKSMMVLQKGP